MCRTFSAWILAMALWTGLLDNVCEAQFVPRQRELKSILERHASAPVFPELEQASPQAILQTPRGQALYEWAKSAPVEIPQLTYNLYRIYKRTGEREAFQTVNVARRHQLTQACLRAWFEPSEPAHLDAVNDLIWAICEETTWVLPAHEGPEWNIDLANAEMGAFLADVTLLLGARLPEDIRERMRREVDRRILTNFLEYYDHDVHWWHKGLNNWTGVCSGSIGQAALVFEQNPKRQAKILSIVLGQLDRYIKNGFEEDGGCLEGVGYWNYGLLHFVAFAEMLCARTEGELDLLTHPKIPLIARYPLVMSLGEHNYASFADSRFNLTLNPAVTARLAAKTGVDELLTLTQDLPSGRLDAVIRGLLWWDGAMPEQTRLSDVMLPASGVCRFAGEAPGMPVILVAKAGHNDESHNHNDVGSFVVSVGKNVYLCDPGVGLYQLSYFDARRYENIFTRSYGHSVPLIDGKEQPAGKAYHGVMSLVGEKSVRIDLTKAYPVEHMTSAVRTLTMDDNGRIVLVDTFHSSGDGLSVEEAFMTWQTVVTDGAIARITTPEGCLVLETSEGVFAVQTFEEECRANKKDGILSRISLSFEPAQTRAVRVTMRFEAP